MMSLDPRPGDMGDDPWEEAEEDVERVVSLRPADVALAAEVNWDRGGWTVQEERHRRELDVLREEAMMASLFVTDDIGF